MEEGSDCIGRVYIDRVRSCLVYFFSVYHQSLITLHLKNKIESLLTGTTAISTEYSIKILSKLYKANQRTTTNIPLHQPTFPKTSSSRETMAFKSPKSTITVSDDAASTHSYLSTTTTLKGTDAEPTKKKWLSLKKTEKTGTSTPKNTARAEKALHYEAMAFYLGHR